MTVASGGCKATISTILPDYKMPYFEDGTQPDMIFNIHSICTRRSMGILFEGLVSYLALYELKVIDATPF